MASCKNNNRRYFVPAMVFALLSFSNAALARVKLPAIFSDHMVLQQKAKVLIWGWADPGEKVTVLAGWMKKAAGTQADASGKWSVRVQTPPAGGPFTLNIDGSNHIGLDDVLVGEVWLCSGQSNMVYTLGKSQHAEQEIAASDIPSIRYFSVTRQYASHLFDDSPGAIWQKSGPATAPAFSAVAYFFAKKIHEQLNVPVGIVYSAWGGTPAEAWTPEPALKDDTVLSRYNDRWKYIQENVGKDSVVYHTALDKWEKEQGKGPKKPEEPQTLYYYERPWREPGVLFNGMINPVIPFGIKGVLWYQGESNVNYADEYYRLLSAMIREWRARWAAGGKPSGFPFYVVQISAFGYSSLDNAAKVREAEYEIMKKVPNTGVAVTTDLGNMKNIHFTRKKEIGDRLALIALARDYGDKKIVYKGPEAKKIVAVDGKAVVDFEPSAAGLAAGDEAKPSSGDRVVKGFEIGYRAASGDSVIFVPANAKVEGNSVIVWKEGVADPIEVRYAWLLVGEANLFDTGGLPAFPFRMKIGGKH
jgi:sialate O-acetylesterase